MTQTFTAIYEQYGDWWIGQAQELPGAIIQERTLEEAKESMREVIRLKDLGLFQDVATQAEAPATLAHFLYEEKKHEAVTAAQSRT